MGAGKRLAGGTCGGGLAVFQFECRLLVGSGLSASSKRADQADLGQARRSGSVVVLNK